MQNGISPFRVVRLSPFRVSRTILKSSNATCVNCAAGTIAHCPHARSGRFEAFVDQLRSSLDSRYRGPKPPHRLGQFEANIAATQHDEMLGHSSKRLHGCAETGPANRDDVDTSLGMVEAHVQDVGRRAVSRSQIIAIVILRPDFETTGRKSDAAYALIVARPLRS